MPPDAVNPDFVKPPVDLPYWYSNAKPGPKQACTSQSGTPPAFDNDATMNRSLPTAVDLTPALAYDCQVKDAEGNLLGRIAWTPGNPGTLTIAGTLFFDGNISFNNSASAVYVGRATLYAAGTISINNSSKLCGVAGCNANWDPTVNLLAFVAGSSTGRCRLLRPEQLGLPGCDLCRQRLLRADRLRHLGSDRRAPGLPEQQHDEPLRAAWNAPRRATPDLPGSHLDREPIRLLGLVVPAHGP